MSDYLIIMKCPYCKKEELSVLRANREHEKYTESFTCKGCKDLFCLEVLKTTLIIWGYTDGEGIERFPGHVSKRKLRPYDFHPKTGALVNEP